MRDTRYFYKPIGFVVKNLLIFATINRKFNLINNFMKTLQKLGAYSAPVMREVLCNIEAGFAVSVPGDFEDLGFEGREDE